MSNPTSNFNWQMPTSTDLVSQLPADFEVFGQAVDTSLADLKGGTAGQVLAKNTNADMDFVWVAQDDSNAIQNAIVDAKGDLIAATAADTPARLASSGVNGNVLTVDTTAATGLAWAAPVAASGPAFRAYRNTSQQTFSQNTYTKVQFNAETFDTDNCFDPTTNYRFTPNKAGYYEVHCMLSISKTGASTTLATFQKNGGIYSKVYNWVNTSTFSQLSGSDIVYMNGSTDYLEILVYDSDPSGRGVLNGESETYFSGAWIRS